MKQTLENFLNELKQIGKNIAKYPIRSFFAFSMPFFAVESLRGAEILICNSLTPTDPNIENMIAYFRTFPDANEGKDNHDADFIGSPCDNAMEISSNEPGFRARINAKKENTPYAEFDLALKAYLPGTRTNKLKFLMNDANGLENRRVITYDINDPNNTVHDVNKDPGVITQFIAYYLVNQPAGQYATWRIETPAVVPGDVAGPNGIGKLDGKVDYWDIKCIADDWLKQTFEGENYNWGDVDYDRVTNFKDFNIGADSYNPN